jgi:PAS domain S-box-containing protein
MVEAELFPFLGNNAHGVFVLRYSGEICFWNHFAETLFGFASEEVLGKTYSAALHSIGALETAISN